jgi:hypothetical protein
MEDVMGSTYSRHGKDEKYRTYRECQSEDMTEIKPLGDQSLDSRA